MAVTWQNVAIISKKTLHFELHKLKSCSSDSELPSFMLYFLTLAQKTQLMIRAQRCRAQCHPGLCKLYSVGPSEPEPGGMPTSWFVQSAFCQKSIPRGRWALGFLLQLSWDDKLLQNLKSRWFECLFSFVTVQCWVIMFGPAFFTKKKSVWAAPSSLLPRLLMTTLQTYRSIPSWQRKGFSWLLV